MSAIQVPRVLAISEAPCSSADNTARKIGFALFLIRIKDEVKYNNIFDNTFDAHQICDTFVYTFDSNQK